MISIIVPVYQCEKYLTQCVESLLGQTCRDLELILVDDGSSDGSGEICDRFAAQDTRVRVIHTENFGASHARNIGLDAAKGEWIGFCDSDDTVDADMYQRMLTGMTQTGCDGAVCGYRRCTASLEPISADCPDRPEVMTRVKAMKCVLCDPYYAEYQGYLWNRLFKRETIEQYRIRFDEHIVFSEDKLFIYSCLDHVSHVYYTPKPYYNYRANPEGLTKTDRYLDGGRDEVYVYHRLMATLRNADPEVRRILTGWNIHNSIVRLWFLLKQGKENPQLEEYFAVEFRDRHDLSAYPEYVRKKQIVFAKLYRFFPGSVRKLLAR